jgi:ribosomal protein L37AE/L43A
MANALYFVQECPTCGRKLQVRVEYLGKRVVCRHCAASFEAYDPSTGDFPPVDSSLSVLARAEQLIKTASQSGIGVPS